MCVGNTNKRVTTTEVILTCNFYFMQHMLCLWDPISVHQHTTSSTPQTNPDNRLGKSGFGLFLQHISHHIPINNWNFLFCCTRFCRVSCTLQQRWRWRKARWGCEQCSRAGSGWGSERPWGSWAPWEGQRNTGGRRWGKNGRWGSPDRWSRRLRLDWGAAAAEKTQTQNNSWAKEL